MKGDAELIQKLFAVLRTHCKKNVCRRLQLEDRMVKVIQDLQHWEIYNLREKEKWLSPGQQQHQ